MNSWYFPRTDLAEKYFKVFEIGISSSLAMIAPRRKGKTLFLLNDIVNLASKNRYIPVYTSLWENINSPEKALIKSLKTTIESLDKKKPLSKIFDLKLNKVSLGNELIGRVEVELADSPEKPNSDDLLLLDKLLTTLERKAKSKSVLLLIDEVQHLATSEHFSPIAHTLRTILDKRQGSVKSIFTGSSRHYMNVLLSESKSPFFHFPEMLPFPDLGDDFIEFIVNGLDIRHRVSVSKEKLREVFSSVDKSPYWIMKLISYMVSFSTSLDDSLSHTLQLMEAMNGFESIAKKIKPIDKIVFLALYSGEDPFSNRLLEKIEKETPLKGAYSNVQRSLQRLIAQGLVSQIVKGEYEIEKAGFARFLLSKE